MTEENGVVSREEFQNLQKQLESLTRAVTMLAKVKKAPIKKRRPTKKKKSKVGCLPKKIIQEIEEVAPQENSSHVVSLIKRGRPNNNVVTNGESKGKQCRVEPFVSVTNRPNIFLQSDIAHSFKKDIATDKILQKNLTISPRRPQITMYEVECKKCGKTYVVSGDMLMPDADTGDVSYTCNNCIRKS